MIYLKRPERIIVACLTLSLATGMIVFAVKHYRPPVSVSIDSSSRINKADTASKPEISRPSVSLSNLINVNTADAAQFERLKGIGPKLARRIVAYRQTNGRFVTKDDLKRVDGIGDKLFETIKDKVYID